MPPVVVGAVGVGLAAAGTIASISAQNAQVAAINASIDAKQLQAKDQLRLAEQEFAQTSKFAQQVKDKELMLNRAQKQTAMLQIEQQVLENELAKRQTDMQATGLRDQAAQQARQLMGEAYNQGTQLRMQSANEMNETLGLESQKNQLNAGKQLGAATQNRQTGKAELGTQERGELAAHEAIIDPTTNMQLSEYQVNAGISDAGNYGNIFRGMGETAAGYMERTQGIQNQAIDQYVPFARGTVKRTANRNSKAIRAAYNSNQAAGQMELLNQYIATRAEHQALEAQRQPGAGLLSYIQGAGNVLNAGMQSGLFNFNRTPNMPFGTQQMQGLGQQGNFTQPAAANFNSGNYSYRLGGTSLFGNTGLVGGSNIPASRIDTMPPVGASTSLISNYPSTVTSMPNTFGLNSNSLSLIMR